MLLGYALLLKRICYMLGEPFPADVLFLWLVCLSMEMNIVTILPGKFNKQNSFPHSSASLCPSWSFINSLRICAAQQIIFPSLQCWCKRRLSLALNRTHWDSFAHSTLLPEKPEYLEWKPRPIGTTGSLSSQIQYSLFFEKWTKHS